jgi:hypothetical protein
MSAVPLNIDVSTPLRTLMASAGADCSIYVNGGLPSSGLPASFILIETNGGIKTNASKFGNAFCVLSVSIYVALLSNGAVNPTKEDILLGKFQSLFQSVIKITVGSNHFTYELSANPMMYSGKSLISGYSTKILNVNCFINY